MSPLTVVAEVIDLGFPRVSGDEPMQARELAVSDLFSPRERG